MLRTDEDALQLNAQHFNALRCRRRTVVYLLMCGVGGCIPTVSTFYDINGVGEKRYTSGCSMNAEADLSMRLTDTTGVVFWGPAERKSIHQAILSVSVTVMAGEKVSLTEPSVTIIAKELQRPLELPIATIRRAAAVVSPSCEPPADSIYQAPNDVMERMPGTYHSRSVVDSVFVIELVVPDRPAEFSVQMSPLSIDGKITAVPAVHFVRKTKAQLIGAFSGSTIG